MSYFSSDVALGRRLEHAEAAGVRKYASFTPGAEYLDTMGGCAVFAGVGGFATQAIGLGMDGPVTEAELDAVEEFYRARGSVVPLNLSPLAHATLWELVMKRPYTIREIENLMVAQASACEVGNSVARRTQPGEERTWSSVVAQGFSGLEDPPPMFDEMLAPTASISECYACYDGERMVAGGAMNIEDGVALLYGDATLISHRGRGFQTAIIQARLNRAIEAGCEYAMATVNAGSGSHRNYERLGFRLMYTRVNVKREWT